MATNAPALSDRVMSISQAIFTADDLIATDLDEPRKVRCASVIVVSHAEIEDAVENACRVASQALVDCPPLGFSFLAWGLAGVAGIEDLPKKNTAVDNFVSRYRVLIENSHGITRKHLEALLIPLGVSLKSLNVDIGTLESFGRLRGAKAHLSPFTAVMQDAPSKIQADAVGAARAAENVISEILNVGESIRSGVPLPSRGWFSRIFARR